jgi:hypothetical protein
MRRMAPPRFVCWVGVGVVALSVALVSPAVAGIPAMRADRALDRALEKVVETPGGPPGVISLVRRGGGRLCTAPGWPI